MEPYRRAYIIWSIDSASPSFSSSTVFPVYFAICKYLESYSFSAAPYFACDFARNAKICKMSLHIYHLRKKCHFTWHRRQIESTDAIDTDYGSCGQGNCLTFEAVRGFKPAISRSRIRLCRVKYRDPLLVLGLYITTRLYAAFLIMILNYCTTFNHSKDINMCI